MEQRNTSQVHASPLKSRDMQTFTKRLDLLTYIAIKWKEDSVPHPLSHRDMAGGYGSAVLEKNR